MIGPTLYTKSPYTKTIRRFVVGAIRFDCGPGAEDLKAYWRIDPHVPKGLVQTVRCAARCDDEYVVLPEADSETTKPDLDSQFRLLANQWRRETGHISSISKRSMHPAYQKIIAMGRDVIPLILHDLARTRGHWLWALHVLTDEDPAPENATFKEAVDAWLDWGFRRGYL